MQDKFSEKWNDKMSLDSEGLLVSHFIKLYFCDLITTGSSWGSHSAQGRGKATCDGISQAFLSSMYQQTTFVFLPQDPLWCEGMMSLTWEDMTRNLDNNDTEVCQTHPCLRHTLTCFFSSCAQRWWPLKIKHIQELTHIVITVNIF